MKLRALPSDYPRYVDRAALLKLANVLDPKADIVKMTGTTTVARGKTNDIKNILDGRGKLKKISSRKDGYTIIFNGFDEKEKQLEQSLPRKEIAQILDDEEIPVFVIDSQVVARKAENDCPVCDQHGIEQILTYEIKKHGAGASWFLPTESNTKFMVKGLKTNGYESRYPTQGITKHLRSLLLLENMLGSTGNHLLQSDEFLPKKHCYRLVERMQDPWTTDKFWTDLVYPSWGCGSIYEFKRTGKYFGASPQEA